MKHPEKIENTLLLTRVALALIWRLICTSILTGPAVFVTILSGFFCWVLPKEEVAKVNEKLKKILAKN